MKLERHRLPVCQNFVIPKAQYTIALHLQPACACQSGGIVGVLASVCLNDQALFVAKKINDIRPDWTLSPERVCGEAPVTQQIPERKFGRRRRAAHGLGAGAQYPLTPLA